MAQKTYTEKNVIIKKGRIHAGISQEFVVKSVLDDYETHGEIPPEVGKDGKERAERGLMLPIETPLNVEEYSIEDVKNLDQVVLAKWGNRPGIHFVTKLSNCKSPKFTKNVWVKYAEGNGNLTVITAYPAEDPSQMGNKGYAPYRNYVEGNDPKVLLDKDFLLTWFKNRGKVMILEDDVFGREIKPADLNSEYKMAIEAAERTKNVGIFSASDTPTIPMN